VLIARATNLQIEANFPETL
jgi:hypothetical protein